MKLEAGTKRLLQLISINVDCCDDDEYNSSDNDESSNPLYMYPSPTPGVTIEERINLLTQMCRKIVVPPSNLRSYEPYKSISYLVSQPPMLNTSLTYEKHFVPFTFIFFISKKMVNDMTYLMNLSFDIIWHLEIQKAESMRKS